jgi:hypothetical protein
VKNFLRSSGVAVTPRFQRAKMNHLPISFAHWLRQSDAALKSMNEERVYQISQVPRADLTQRPEVIALTSKTSAKRLMAALALQESPYRFAVTAVFSHPLLPGLER